MRKILTVLLLVVSASITAGAQAVINAQIRTAVDNLAAQVSKDPNYKTALQSISSLEAKRNLAMSKAFASKVDCAACADLDQQEEAAREALSEKVESDPAYAAAIKNIKTLMTRAEGHK